MDSISDSFAVIIKVLMALVISVAALLVLRGAIRACSWLYRQLAKCKYRVRVMGRCVRIDERTYQHMGELEKSIIPVYEVEIDGEKKIVYSTASTIPCNIQKGDEFELLVNPKSRKAIFSEKGLRKYKSLVRQREKFWWLLDLFFVLLSMTFVSAWLIFFN